MVAMYQSIDIREEKQDERRGSALPPDAPPSASVTSNDLNAQHSGAWDPLEPVHETIGGSAGFSAISRPEYVPSQSIDFMDNIVKDREVRDSVLHDLWQFRRRLDDSSISNEVLFEAYRRLPAPRVTYLGLPELRRFLARLSWNKKVTEPVMVRFLSVLDDMKAANIEILGKEWNTAIHFAGRFAGRITGSEVESALHMWREMEREAGVQSDTCSFNILFDLASKAKKFALASMILKEMKARKLPFSRTTRMTLIYYRGLCGDGDGIRQEYANMVSAGEIIDSNVLTNVITSLIHAGEPSTAEQTFERMKTLHAERTGATLPPRGWEANRRMRKTLTEAAERWRDNPEARSNIQEAAPLAPSLITYRVLIEYHSFDAGNFDRTFSLLDEMERAGLQPDGTTYYWLLAGFAQHGGVRYSAWTWTHLEQIMAQCFATCEERPYEAGLGRGIAAMAVRAFAQCANIERAREIWEDIKLRWTPSEDTITAVHTVFLKKRESSSL
jgi:pentatricopeptide repeat protein